MMISEKEMCSVINKRKEKKMMGVDKLIYDELAFFYFSSFEQRLYPLFIYIYIYIYCYTLFFNLYHVLHVLSSLKLSNVLLYFILYAI